MPSYALGLDYGTSSVRALLVDLESGAEVAHAVEGYPHGTGGVILDPAQPDLARQHPPDYLAVLRRVVPAVLAAGGVDPAAVAGIGVDATGSTPIPVDRAGRALAEHAEFAAEPAAQAWLWKDHTAQAEAEEITERARQARPAYAERVGGSYSAEWFWAKVLRCRRAAPRVFERAWSWVELCDFVPAWLVGERDPQRLARSVCAAGHKALYAPDWGGLPDTEFLALLDPGLADLRERLYAQALPADRKAGGLARAAAEATGLRPGTPVAVGALDAHLGAVGAGIRPGVLVKVLGTSACDLAVAEPAGAMPPARGLCGVVRGSILPGLLGFEAGQAAVGDVFAWCGRLVNRSDLDELAAQAARVRPGASGLLALDWHNGNRSVLADPALSGVVLGLNLHTTDAELYRAMLEATAFGARVIVERLLSLGVPVASVVAAGGIAGRSELLLQILADVLGREIQVAASGHASALGAAIAGAVAGGAFATMTEAQAAMVRAPARVCTPAAEAVAVYERLFVAYRVLHDAFGAGQRDVGAAMKDVLRLRREVRG